MPAKTICPASRAASARSRHASATSSSCSRSSSAIERTCSGEWTTTSWRSKAGYLFGTTRTRQPGVSGARSRGSASTSGGVRSSRPSQNGHDVEPLGRDRLEHGCIGARAARPSRRDRDEPARERVDPQLGAQELPLSRSRNGVSRSIGAGKTIVVDCEEPSSTSVCR